MKYFIYWIQKYGIKVKTCSLCTSVWKYRLLSRIGDLSKFYWYLVKQKLPWPSGYELRLSLERSQVLILVKFIGERQEGHPVQKCSLLQQSPN